MSGAIPLHPLPTSTAPPMKLSNMAHLGHTAEFSHIYLVTAQRDTPRSRASLSVRKLSATEQTDRRGTAEQLYLSRV